MENQRSRARHIEEVLGSFVQAHPNLAEADCAELIAAHPNLMPELGEELERFAAIEKGVQGLRTQGSISKHASHAVADSIGASALKAGDHVGPYEIVSVLGEGGMGIVYRARQQRPSREVALKIIQARFSSSKLLRRFEHEAEVLGRLQHGGIAQIYEAGTFGEGSDERPFFAMELIQGSPLNQYAKNRSLSLRDRLALFAKICDAAHHAHQKGVIHRDLKPSNILVTEEGQPKILDFGVARATDNDLQVTTVQTDVAQLIGTVPYMSPEQVGGRPEDLDTRSDVYALGVVLYELLAGRLPYDLKERMIHEAVRVIREDEPTRLSIINTRLRGDIETIVAKALEKDKTRRYQSAAEFGSDVQRYLGDQPILARPPSAAYQFRKFARRNKALVGGAAAVFVTLVGGIIVSSSYAVGEANQRHLAEQNADVAIAERKFAEGEKAKAIAARDEAEAVTQFLSDKLGSADPREAGKDVPVREVLDKAAEAIGERFREKPLIEARLRQTIGVTYLGLGLYPSAETHAAEALEIQRRVLGEEHPKTLMSMGNLAVSLNDQGRYADAEELYRKTLEIQRRVLGEEHPDTLRSKANLANSLYDQGRYAEAEELRRTTLEIQRRVLGEAHPGTLLLMSSLAGSLYAQGRYAEAEELDRNTLEVQRRVLGDEHPDTLSSMNNLAASLNDQGRYAEAEELYRKTLEIQRRVLGGEHAETLVSMNNLATSLKNQGRYADAEELYRKTLEIQRRVLGDEHPNTLISMGNLAVSLNVQGRYAEAEELRRTTLEIQRRVLGEEHPHTLISMGNLASSFHSQGRYAEGEELRRTTLEIRRRVLGEEHPDTLSSMTNLANSLRDQGRYVEAEELRRTTLEVQRRVLGHEHPNTLMSMSNLANSLYDQGRYAEAEELYRKTLEIKRRVLGEEHPDTLRSMANLANSLRDQGRYVEAEELYRKTLEVRRRLLGHEHTDTLYSVAGLAETLVSEEKPEEARGLFRELIAARRKAAEGPSSNPRTQNALSDLLVTCSLEDLRDPAVALPLAEKAVEATIGKDPQILSTLALACFRTGAIDRAVEGQRRALALLPEDRTPTRTTMEGKLGAYLTEQQNWAQAESLLLGVQQALSEREYVPPKDMKESLGYLVKLYESWDAAEPAKGYAEKAAEWRATLEEMQAPQPPSRQATQEARKSHEATAGGNETTEKPNGQSK